MSSVIGKYRDISDCSASLAVVLPAVKWIKAGNCSVYAEL